MTKSLSDARRWKPQRSASSQASKQRNPRTPPRRSASADGPALRLANEGEGDDDAEGADGGVEPVEARLRQRRLHGRVQLQGEEGEGRSRREADGRRLGGGRGGRGWRRSRDKIFVDIVVIISNECHWLMMIAYTYPILYLYHIQYNVLIYIV